MHSTGDTIALDPRACREARLSRDARFDGEFYFGVSSTGIYCRPICPARPPAEKNVSYFRSAAQAAEAGFRPCLRCRPESAPGSPAWNGTATTVHRALELIALGELNNGPVTALAERLGVGERYLRKLFQREVGVSPQALALNQRLLFARKLLAETDLPITQVAFAAGFGSVRRFNSAVQEQLRQTPKELRKQGKRLASQGAVRLTLQYRPPYDWDGVIDYFARHAVDGVEQVNASGYTRRVSMPGGIAELQVSPIKNKHALQLSIDAAGTDSHFAAALMPTVSRVRRMFDLDANPHAIATHLGKDPALAPLLQRYPGVRSPGSWSLFESSVRAIVGQQVSTAAVRNVLARLAAACNDEPVRVFPAAAELARLPEGAFPMPGRRRDTLQQLCRDYSGREEQLDLSALAERRGVGPWTVAMVAMRGAGQPAPFPHKDLGLEKAWAALANDGVALTRQAERWQPWGAYAANLLWRSLSE